MAPEGEEIVRFRVGQFRSMLETHTYACICAYVWPEMSDEGNESDTRHRSAHSRMRSRKLSTRSCLMAWLIWCYLHSCYVCTMLDLSSKSSRLASASHGPTCYYFEKYESYSTSSHPGVDCDAWTSILILCTEEGALINGGLQITMCPTDRKQQQAQHSSGIIMGLSFTCNKAIVYGRTLRVTRPAFVALLQSSDATLPSENKASVVASTIMIPFMVK